MHTHGYVQLTALTHAVTATHELEGTPDMLKAYSRIQARLNSLRTEEEGATAVEYGLIVALIAAIIVGIVATLGTQIAAAFQTVVDALPTAP